MMTLNFIEVAPVAYQTDGVLVNGEIKAVTTPCYTKTEQGKCLRELRVECGKYLNMREVCAALGISIDHYSGLERGKYTLSEFEWGQVFEAVDKLKTKGES